MTTTTIKLEPRLAHKRIQVINDALPGFILLLSGFEALTSKGFTSDIVPYLSIVVGLVVVRWTVEEFRRKAKPRTVKWFDVAAGCAIIVDAINRYNTHKGFQPAHVLILAGIVIILRGLYEEKFPRRRKVVLSDEGVFARTSPFRSLSCSWTDIEKIERNASGVVFILKSGRKVLSVKRAENGVEIIDRIAEAAAGRGIAVVETR